MFLLLATERVLSSALALVAKSLLLVLVANELSVVSVFHESQEEAGEVARWGDEGMGEMRGMRR
jgi:hypothetical protein